jgi:hypothetical protein
MEAALKSTRQVVEHHIDLLEMTAFNLGFEACLHALDELSDIKHNNHELIFAEHLRTTVRELRGENVD